MEEISLRVLSVESSKNLDRDYNASLNVFMWMVYSSETPVKMRFLILITAKAVIEKAFFMKREIFA